MSGGLDARIDPGEVWVVLPTANAENAAKNLPRWREMGYRVAALQDLRRFDCPADAVIYADSYPGWPASVNRLFREVVPSSCGVVVAIGDDMLPDPDRSAAELAGEFYERFAGTPGGSFGVMQPHGDGFADTRRFCGSPWIGRAWMERMYGGDGGMCRAYAHHFADDELYWVSRCRGALWLRGDVTQRHEHFMRRGEEMPGYWAESVWANDAADALTFIARAHAGFPGHGPVDGVGEGGVMPFDAGVFEREYDGRAEAHYRKHHGGGGDGEDEAVVRLRRAFEACAAAGETRVAVFGAGRHTRRAGAALASPGDFGVTVVGVVDDNAMLRGTRLWNYPVLHTGEAVRLAERGELDAVVLSSDAHEDALAESARPLEAAGGRVVRLYGGDAAGIGAKQSVASAVAGGVA